MMRVCHLDTCPVGVATQNKELRARYDGKAEFVVNFFAYGAQEGREYLAELGFHSIEEAVGRVDCLDVNRAVNHWKGDGLDLSPILHVPTSPWKQDRFCSQSQDHGLDKALDQELIEKAQPALQEGTPVRFEIPVSNVNRTVGTLLGHHLTKTYGGDGLPDNTIDIEMTGSAGQSFGAFVPKGITLRLSGDANDYLGKGLSGGRITLQPPSNASPNFVAEENVIAGNVILYGATAGEAYIRGVVGERFCVRNSGATAVVEGVGDHGCEYMTGGTVVILGSTGRNFGAGMSGGVAFIFDPHDEFHRNLNNEMVDLESSLSEEDADSLREIIRGHLDETNSTVASTILDRWHQHVRSFKKVMPKDYRRVLEAIATAEEHGQDVEEAVMAAAKG